MTVRVLLVDDSAFFRQVLRRLIEGAAGVEVAGEARDGFEAVEATRRLRPDVVLMDVVMPRLDGLEATRRIMAHSPTPILLFTGGAGGDQAAEVDLGLRALEYGALELVPKADLQRDGRGDALVAQLQLLARVPVISHPLGRRSPSSGGGSDSDVGRPRATTFHKRASRVVGVVASTGGPTALRTLLATLPAGLKAAVVVVQHIDAAFHEGLVRWLDEETPLRVVTPEDQQELHTGVVYIAPPGRHAEVTERRRLALVADPLGRGAHCPSGDRLLASAARSYGHEAVGVILTGMGEDGALGLLDLRRAGGTTLAQDEATSVVWGMPQAAVRSGAAARVLPLGELAAAIEGALR